MKYMKFLFAVLGVCAGVLVALPVLADSVSPTSVQQGVSTLFLVDCASASGRSNVVANLFTPSGSSTLIDPNDNGSGVHCNITPHFLTAPATLPNGVYYVDVYSTDGLVSGGHETKAEVEASTGFFETMNLTVAGGSVPSPTVTGIAPSTGTTLGGTTVTITGAGFAPGASVTIGGAPATGVVVNSDGTSITAVTPVHAAGAADVGIANPDRGSAALPSGFTYVAPVLASLTISPVAAQVLVGSSQGFTATGVDQYAAPITFTPTWTSSNTAAAIVDPSTGTATGVSVGTATITAIVGSVTGTVTLTVTAPAVPVVVPAAPSPTVSGGSGVFTAGLLPSIAQQQQRGQVLGAFTTGAHPDGTLVKSGQTVYLIQNGERYGFRNPAEFETYGYSFDQVVPANSQDEALTFSPSNIMKAMEGSLVLDGSDHRTVYVVGNGGVKRGFASEAVLQQLGYSLSGLPVIDLTDYPSGAPIASGTAAHPDGSLVSDGKTVYWLLGNSRQGFASPTVFSTYGFLFSSVVKANAADLAFPQGSLVKFRDGTLVQDGSSGYVISDGKASQFSSAASMSALGYQQSNVVAGSVADYEKGTVI